MRKLPDGWTLAGLKRAALDAWQAFDEDASFVNARRLEEARMDLVTGLELDTFNNGDRAA